MPKTKRSQRLHRRTSWRLAVPVVAGLAGALFVTSALSSDGTELRSENSDLDTLIRERATDLDQLREEVTDTREANRELARSVDEQAVLKQRERAQDQMPHAGFTAVDGPGIRISLTDAPRESDAEGVDPNLLVVHQQDIQAFVNALWAGGAEAISLQDQRLITTTGIKCVGNTVVLDGVPYAPPYVIEAVGDVDRMQSALEASDAVSTYKDYVERFDLGLETEVSASLDIPAYRNVPELEYAELAE